MQATKQYKIGGLDEVDSVRQSSEEIKIRRYEKRFKDFLELSSDKRPSNDKATKESRYARGINVLSKRGDNGGDCPLRKRPGLFLQ